MLFMVETVSLCPGGDVFMMNRMLFMLSTADDLVLMQISVSVPAMTNWWLLNVRAVASNRIVPSIGHLRCTFRPRMARRRW